MKDRIKYVRKQIGNNLTQEEFAKRIGIKQSTVTSYETGNRIPTGAVITSICREFHICEEWMRHGTGPIESPRPVDAIDLLARQHNLGAGGKALLSVATQVISDLPEDQADALLDKLSDLIQTAIAERDAERIKDRLSAPTASAAGADESTGD